MKWLKEQIKKKAYVPTPYNLKDAEVVGLSDILGVLKKFEQQLQNHIEQFPETAIIGWAPNPEVTKNFDEWFVELKRLLGVVEEKKDESG